MRRNMQGRVKEKARILLSCYTQGKDGGVTDIG